MRRTRILWLSLILTLLSSGLVQAADLLKKETKHFVFYYKPVGVTSKMDERVQEIENYYERLMGLLGGKPGRKITVKWYPTREEYQKADASKYAGFVDYRQKEVRTGGEPSMLIYGVTFILADAVGKPSGFVLNGLSVAFFQEHEGKSWYWGVPLATHLKANMGQWIELKRLANNMDYFEDQAISRAEAGLFIRHLVDTYGVEQFRKFMKNIQPESDISNRLKLTYKKNLVEIEAELKEYVSSSVPVQDDPAMAPLLDTASIHFSEQRFVFADDEEKTEHLTRAAAQADAVLASLQKDLGLAPSGQIQWRIMSKETLKTVKGVDGNGYVDESGVVRTNTYGDPRYVALAAVQTGSRAPNVLKWGVALVWGVPEGGQAGWDGRSLKSWGTLIAKEDMLIPLEKLFTDFPGGAPERARAEAGLLVRYLVDTYGKEKFAGFFKAAESQEALIPALEALTGKPLAETEKEFFASLVPSAGS